MPRGYSGWNKGIPQTKEVRQKLSLSLTGRRPIWDKERMERVRQLYWEEELTLKEIASQFGCTLQNIRGAMIANNVPTRGFSEAALLKYKKYPQLLGSKSNRWKGGRCKTADGYIFVYISSGEYIAEHRLVMEQQLGRKLLPKEQVHHINGIKDDNDPKNLLLLSPGGHTIRTMICEQCPLRLQQVSRKSEVKA